VACPHCGHVQQEPPGAYSTVCKKCHQHYRVQEVLKPAAKRKERPKDLQRAKCPHCGNTQDEPKAAYSTVCKKCKQHFRIQEEPSPATAAAAKPPKEMRVVSCFQCATELEVAPAAKSTMCKRCSSFVDLSDYRIDQSVTKNFKTKGRFVVEPKGYVFNTDSLVGDAVLKGRLHGKLTVEGSLEIYSTAEIKGSFRATHLIIPAGEQFRWQAEIVVASAEIAGELVGKLRASQTVALGPMARMFGDVTAGGIVVKSGAVFVGMARVGKNASAPSV